LATRVDTWGPPPLEAITKSFFEMSATDINARITDEGRVPLVPLVHAHEVKGGGVVMRDENVNVTAAVVKHPPMVPSFGYRFDAHDRSIVISGDTAPSENLIVLAKGADVLVHTAAYMPAVDRLVARVPNATNLKRTIVAGQTSVEDAGRVAQSAGVKTLVLSHLIPPDDDSVTDEMWIEAARTTFRGTIVVAKDLMEI
jgi:ribonuclease BN (tRNA processing enzyme)